MQSASEDPEPESRPGPRLVEGTSTPAGGRGRRVWLIVLVLSLAALGSAYWVKSSAEDGPGDSKSEGSDSARAVRVTKVQSGTLPLLAEYRGELDTEIAELAAQGTGRLLAVEVNLGDRFEKGEVLAKVDAAETRRLLAEAQAQVQSASAEKRRATAELENAKSESHRGTKLLDEQVISAQEVSRLESRVNVLEAQVGAAEADRAAAASRVELYREQLSQAELRAPFDGAVGRRYLDAGATVAPGTPVLRLVKGGPLEVRFRASEVHVTRLQPGTPIEVRTLGTGDRVFHGSLSRVSAEISRTDRTVEAEGVLSQEHSELRPGMYATVSASLGNLDGAALVDDAALLSKIAQDGTSERGLFVVRDKKAAYVPVQVLGKHDGKAAVSGVEPGDVVVVQGQDLLSDGAAVKIAKNKDP